MSSLAAFIAGSAVGLIGVIASARRAVPAASINVAIAASPSRRSALVRGLNILSINFSLTMDSIIAALRLAPSLFNCSRSQDETRDSDVNAP